MAWFSDKNNTRVLLRALGSNDINKRNQAASEFLQMGEEGAEILISALDSQDPTLRELSARILVKLDAQALPALSAALKNAPPATKEEVFKILGKLKSQASFELLIASLKGTKFQEQILAAKTLGEIGDPQAIPQLLVALSDGDPDVRIAAATALGKFRAPQTYPNIADLLDDVEINVRMAAAKILGEIHDPITIPYLAEALRDSFWWLGRDEAIEILMGVIASFGKDALDDLIEVMGDKEPSVRRFAIALLRPLKEPRILEGLEMAFYDNNYDVSETALEALIEFEEIALPILVEAIGSPTEWLRMKAVNGLGEIGGDQAVIHLLEMLGDKSPIVRKETIGALKKLKDARALPTLSAIAADRKDKEISRLARQAIAAIEASY